MKSEPIQTNFNVSSITRNKFDQICRLSGRTRTSVLVELMENYVLNKGPVLSDRIKSIQSMNLLPDRPNPDPQTRPNEDYWESVSRPFWVSNGREFL
jgi:hypothetical protein